MKQRSGRPVGCWVSLVTLGVALGCSGASAVVGGNNEEVAAGGGPAGEAPGGSARRWSTFVAYEPGRCLPWRLPLESDGSAACKLFMSTAAGGACTCDAPYRQPASDQVVDLLHAAAREALSCDATGRPDCEDLCVCENLEATGDAAEACRDGSEAGERGFCYVAPDQGLGAPETVADCETEPRVAVRFAAGEGEDPRAFMVCSDATEPEVVAGPLGAVCVPELERDPSFSGFQLEEVNVETGAASCASGTCLVQRFRGRVSCPLGNLQSSGFDDSCLVPGSHQPVTVPVPSQLVSRPPSSSAFCSCRCAGPGEGPFCECAQGQECVPLIEELGLGGDQLAGSYCVPRGATDGPSPHNGQTGCDQAPEQCAADRPF
jgi:hypothetical protein